MKMEIAWQDSTPVLYIVGNVATFRRGKCMAVRAYGFQELEFVDMVKGITKAAVEPDKAEHVIPELDRLIRIAKEGRKGPVVLSIPDDLQRAQV